MKTPENTQKQHLDRVNRAAHLLMGAEGKIGIPTPDPKDVEAVGIAVATLVSATNSRTPHYASYKDVELFDAVADMHGYYLNQLEFMARLGESANMMSMIEAYLTGLSTVKSLNHLEVLSVGGGLARLNAIHERMKTGSYSEGDDGKGGFPEERKSWWGKLINIFGRSVG